MKLNAFIDKSQRKSYREPSVFHLGNEVKENKLQEEVTELRNIENKYKELRQVTSALEGAKERNESNLTRLIELNGELQSKITRLEGNLAEQAPIMHEIKDIRRDFATLSTSKQEVEVAFSNLNFEHNKVKNDLEELKTRSTTLEIENRGLFTKLTDAEDTLKQVNPALENITEAYNTLQSTYNDLKWECERGQKVNKRLQTSNEVLEKDNKVLKNKIEDSTETQEQFTSWLDTLKNYALGGMVGPSEPNEEYSEAVNTILTMGARIKDWEQFIAYLKWYNNTNKEQEKYKIPLASDAVNYNTTYLGNGRATLLKFKGAKV